jgi:hypothetical protein
VALSKSVMTSRKRFAFLTFFCFHFFLILAVCWRDTFFLLKETQTIAPPNLSGWWEKGEDLISASLAQDLASANPVHQAVSTYLNAAGIESGYGFFAPNVPNPFKLVFELEFPDGHVEYELPAVAGSPAGMRLGDLYDRIAFARYSVLRQLMLQMLTQSVWRQHPDAVKIRAIFGVIALPTILQFRRGEKESYTALYAYDFEFANERSKRSGQ